MYQINNLTTNGNQTTTALLEDGTSVTLKFLYRAAVQRWTVDVSRGSFVAKGIGLATNPNLLRIWRNIIPFGLAVVTANGTDPFLADDLQTGRVKLFMLDGTRGRADLTAVEAAISA